MTIQPSRPIPVEKGWPLLGILPGFLKGDPYEYLKNIMLKQGGFVQLNFGPMPVYLVSHPDYLQRILRDNYQNYRKPSMFYDIGREIMGNGLILSSGDEWLRQRRMIQPHLHRKQLVNLFDDMVKAISNTLKSWEALADTNIEITLHEKMIAVSSNVTMQTLFGSGILSPDEASDIGKRIPLLSKYAGETIYSNILPAWFPIPGRKQFLENLDAIKASIKKIIVECRKNKEASASLIQMLLHSVDEESQQSMTEAQLYDEVMTLVIAGYETTATTLIWLAAILYQHPEVLKKLQAEVDTVLVGRTPTMQDIPQLSYTRQVFMEVLRMHSVIPFLPRALNEADQLGEYHLPANALLLMFFHGVHHNPQIWDEPEAFKPERFSPENIGHQHPFAYLAFSAGPRKCAGDEFALLEGTLAIAMMMQKFDLHFSPNQTFPAKVASITYPKNDVRATLSLRPSLLEPAAL